MVRWFDGFEGNPVSLRQFDFSYPVCRAGAEQAARGGGACQTYNRPAVA